MGSEKGADLALALATRAARDVGLDPEGARLHRQVSSTQVVLPAAGVMARIEKQDQPAIAERCVIAGRYLEAKGVAAARLVIPDRQPLVYPEGSVTLWRLVEIVTARPSAKVLGAFARLLHGATAGELPAEMPDLDVFGPIGLWLDDLEGHALSDLGSLRGEAECLERSWRGAIESDPLGVGFVHGDFHRDNLVMSPDGPVLLDLEDSCKGPVSWDLVPQFVGMRRYGVSASRWSDFKRGYGADPSTGPGFELLCRVFELSMTMWALAHRHVSSQMAREADVRVEGFLGRDDTTWTLI